VNNIEIKRVKEKTIIKAFRFNKDKAIKIATKQGFTNVSEGVYKINGINMYFQRTCNENVDIIMYVNRQRLIDLDNDKWIIMSTTDGDTIRDVLNTTAFKKRYKIIEER